MNELTEKVQKTKILRQANKPVFFSKSGKYYVKDFELEMRLAENYWETFNPNLSPKLEENKKNFTLGSFDEIIFDDDFECLDHLQ